MYQRYEIVLNQGIYDYINLDMLDADEIAEKLSLESLMEEFSIEIDEDDMLTGEIQFSAIESFGGVTNVINELREYIFIDDIKPYKYENKQNVIYFRRRGL